MTNDNVREPGVIEDVYFHKIDTWSLDELHDELANLFTANAEEAAAHYLSDPDDGESLRKAA